LKKDEQLLAFFPGVGDVKKAA